MNAPTAPRQVLSHLPPVPVRLAEAGKHPLPLPARQQVDDLDQKLSALREQAPVVATLLNTGEFHEDAKKAVKNEWLAAYTMFLELPSKTDDTLSKIESLVDAHHAFRAKWKPSPETANIETDLEAIIKGLEKRHPTVPYLVPKDWEQAYNGLLDAMVLVDQLESAFGLSAGEGLRSIHQNIESLLNLHNFGYVNRDKAREDALADLATTFLALDKIFASWRSRFFEPLACEAACHALHSAAANRGCDPATILDKAWQVLEPDIKASTRLSLGSTNTLFQETALYHQKTHDFLRGILDEDCQPGNETRVSDFEVAARLLQLLLLLIAEWKPVCRGAASKALANYKLALEAFNKRVLDGYIQGLVRMHKQTLAQEQQKAVMAAAQPAPRRFKFRGLFSRLGGSRATE